MSDIDGSIALVCHRDTPTAAVHSIRARACFAADGSLMLSYRLGGDLDRLRIPTAETPLPVDRLWQHTCFEAFVGVAGDAAYREFNFSPSGQAAAYAFCDYRAPAADAGVLRLPRITRCRRGERLELDAVVAAEALPPAATGARLQVGLSAVVEAASGAMSYWALRHPAGRPDFHDRDVFALVFPVAERTP